MMTRMGMCWGVSGVLLLGHVATAAGQTGACCLPGPACQNLTAAACQSAGGTYGGDGTACSGRDCNYSGVDDFCDLLSGQSHDCNLNGWPDECDVNGGCDPTTHPCSCDCQCNGIPDECELGEWAQCGFNVDFEAGVPVGWQMIQQQPPNYTWHLATMTSAPVAPHVLRVNSASASRPQDERLFCPDQGCEGAFVLQGWTVGSLTYGVPPNDRYDVEVWVTRNLTLGDADDVRLGLLDDWWQADGQWAHFHYIFAAPAGRYLICFRYVGVEGSYTALDGLTLHGTPLWVSFDCAGDGVPDECQLFPICPNPWPACLLDMNENVVDDECEVSCRGDSNCDGLITWRDIDFFVAALGGAYGDPDAWLALHAPGYPQCSFFNNDLDGDGYVTWRDVDGFVAVLNTPCP